MSSQIMLTCAKCGKTFWSKRANAVNVTNDRTFCSQECYAASKGQKK